MQYVIQFNDNKYRCVNNKAKQNNDKWYVNYNKLLLCNAAHMSTGKFVHEKVMMADELI